MELCVETKRNNPHKQVFVLGKLIHNKQAIEYLNNQGIQTVERIEDIPEDSTCVIRSHGEGPGTIKVLKDRGVEIIDATCPDVKRVQNTAASLASQDYQVIIIGKSDHPEIKAIKQHTDAQNKKAAVIVSSIEDVEKNLDLIKTEKKIGVVVQTTKPMEFFATILSHLSRYCYELRAFNTICNTTSNRQEQAKALAKEVECMVIIGDKQSSNTTSLARICKEINVNTIHVETTDELKDHNLNGFKLIGVTAGASTPKNVIDEVIDYLNQ